jgi:chromosome segregation ATPase
LQDAVEKLNCVSEDLSESKIGFESQRRGDTEKITLLSEAQERLQEKFRALEKERDRLKREFSFSGKELADANATINELKRSKAVLLERVGELHAALRAQKSEPQVTVPRRIASRDECDECDDASASMRHDTDFGTSEVRKSTQVTQTEIHLDSLLSDVDVC